MLLMINVCFYAKSVDTIFVAVAHNHEWKILPACQFLHLQDYQSACKCQGLEWNPG